MAGNLTFVITGTPVADPEIRFLPDGTAVATLRFALNQPTSRKDAKTTWARVSLWRDQATRAHEMVKKGTPIQVVGNWVESRQWTDTKGVEQVSTEFSGQSWGFVGNRDSNPSADVPSSDAGGSAPTIVDDIPF